MKINFLITLYVIALLALTSCEIPETGDIEPVDEKVKFYGRVDKKSEELIRFDWPGVYLKTAFEGTSISMIIKDGNNDYNAFIDGRFYTVITTNYQDSIYNIALGLESGIHTLKLTKRTEAFFGIAEFKGFILDPGKELVNLNSSYRRKIEFIGDSYVVGFGNVGITPDCPFSRETQNNYYAYGPMLARKLRAEYSVVAASGIGVIKNFGDTLRQSTFPLPALYDRVCMNDTVAWDFLSWIPDVVVIRLGRNDYSTIPYPTAEMFKSAYRNFLIRIRSYYPDAHIFALCGPIKKDPHCRHIRNVVNNLMREINDKKIHFVQLDVDLKRPDDFGCQWHPNIKGHMKIVDFLEPIIRKELKW